MNDLNIDAVEIENMTLPSSFKSQGFVYVLENELMPGIYKIGMTTKDVQGRCKAYEDYHKTKKPKLETNKVDC